MVAWANKKTIQKEVATVPDGWLYTFAASHPDDVRKLGDSQQSAMLYRSQAILDAIEQGAGQED